MLLIEHKKLNKWLPPGGHLDENEIPHEGAIREVFEETGVNAFVCQQPENNLKLNGIIDIQIPRPYALTYQIIPENSKSPSHIHMDMIFILEADQESSITLSEREIRNIGWFSKSEIQKLDTFDSVLAFAELNLKE